MVKIQFLNGWTKELSKKKSELTFAVEESNEEDHFLRLFLVLADPPISWNYSGLEFLLTGKTFVVEIQFIFVFFSVLSFYFLLPSFLSVSPLFLFFSFSFWVPLLSFFSSVSLFVPFLLLFLLLLFFFFFSLLSFLSVPLLRSCFTSASYLRLFLSLFFVPPLFLSSFLFYLSFVPFLSVPLLVSFCLPFTLPFLFFFSVISCLFLFLDFFFSF